MPIGYYKGLLWSGLSCLGLLVGYYYYCLPPVEIVELASETEYHFEQVDGPIQPIPRSMVSNVKWVQLGKALFNSTLLSSDNSISCASCHLLDYGGDDGLPLSLGVGSLLGERNSPSVFNSVFNFRQFWDGRSHNLAEQIAEPIHNPNEMATNWQDVISKLKQDPEFNQAFSTISSEGITQQAIVKAIRLFEESLITPNAPIDLYLLGNKSALTLQQQRGYAKFSNFGCSTCHQGINIGGNLYQKLGRIDRMPAKLLDDLGRYELTKNIEDKYVFKVPSLRNVADTAPYFHNGSVATLEEAVIIMAQGQLGLSLSQEDVNDLVAALKSFSGRPYTEVPHASR
ncbi:MAG: cytochrome c peroxidase [Paraglaciecola sp.]|uniref:cytochrome-c peroxidase n=1 Tax=Paraglaciecola sp. TaxID=1920173 RepID=UPI0032632E5C